MKIDSGERFSGKNVTICNFVFRDGKSMYFLFTLENGHFMNIFQILNRYSLSQQGLVPEL